VPDLADDQVLGGQPDADLHRGPPGVVDAGREGHQFADVHRLAEDHRVDREGDA
jgi:hypothetical protein